jgi:hypothetical protein
MGDEDVWGALGATPWPSETVGQQSSLAEQRGEPIILSCGPTSHQTVVQQPFRRHGRHFLRA